MGQYTPPDLVVTCVVIKPNPKVDWCLDSASRVYHLALPTVVSLCLGLSTLLMLQENWSAFAPDFKELEENVEYDERESEFDLEDEDKEKVDMKGPDEEDLEVDVTTVEPIQAFVSR